MNEKEIKKILIIKLKGIGDVVLSTVVLDNIRNDFPDAVIDFLTEPPSLPVFENLKQVNSVLVYRKKSFLSGLKIIFTVMVKRYNLVLDFYSNPRTALITFLSLAKYRAGFPYRGRTYAYNLFGPQERSKYHSADLHLQFLKNVGLSYSTKNLYFSLKKKDDEFAKKFFEQQFNKSENIVGLCPGGGWESKKCDPVKFAEIGKAIIEKYNVKLLVLWGPDDLQDAKEIVRQVNKNIVLSSATNISEMAALMKSCKFIVSNDSGPLHIATAVNIPVLGIYGPTDPKLQGPYGEKHEYIRFDELDCINCNLLKCPKQHECFLLLPIDKVMAKISLLIEKNNLSFY